MLEEKKPGVDGKPFNITIGKEIDGIAQIALNKWIGLEILEYPKKNKLAEILYYLSLGFYDRRGWKYKVKINTNVK